MESELVIQIGKEAIFVLLKIAAPPLLTALVVGLIVSLFQALTQIQEPTISFVPKIISVFVAIIIFLPYMGSSLALFVEHVSALIISFE